MGAAQSCHAANLRHDSVDQSTTSLTCAWVLCHAADLPASVLFDDVPDSLNNIATQNGCRPATDLAVAFYKGLLQVAPDLASTFASGVAAQITQCPSLTHLAHLAAAAPPRQLGGFCKTVDGGRGHGRVRQALFSQGLGDQLQSSSLAVTIAKVSCPLGGNATVAAVAIATAAQTSQGVASAAIAGVLTAGVDITSTFEQAAALAAPQRDAAIQAFAAAIVAADPVSQAALISAISSALQTMASSAGAGCGTVQQVLGLLDGNPADGSAPNGLAAVQPAQLLQLCNAVMSCSGVCQAFGLM